MNSSAQVGPLLDLAGIGKSYPGGDGASPTVVLHGLDLRVQAGESVAVVGPSGSGKSTLLNIIGTLDRPDSGQVVFDGTDLATLSDDALAQVRGREIGFVFQLHHLLPQCTVLENVLLPTLATTGSGTRARMEPAEARARRLLQRVGLAGRMTNRPGQLSGGERQRTAVVRALINEPKLLLADEPTGALDGSNAENLAALLLELNREEGVALLTITHALDLAEQMGSTYELRAGSLHRRGESR